MSNILVKKKEQLTDSTSQINLQNSKSLWDSRCSKISDLALHSVKSEIDPRYKLIVLCNAIKSVNGAGVCLNAACFWNAHNPTQNSTNHNEQENIGNNKTAESSASSMKAKNDYPKKTVSENHRGVDKNLNVYQTSPDGYEICVSILAFYYE